MHFVAGLRLLLGAVGEELNQVSSVGNLLVERLGPVDTVHALATTKSGVSGTVVMSFGTEHKRGLTIEVVTTNGSVTWSPTEVSGKEFQYDSGVKSEVAAFGKSLDAKTPDPLQTPEEAFKDLQVLEGLLESKGQLKSVV